ncbi:8524_t:CDS:2 [Ambispora leptoticha]|uniref:8524_t:CDS:1 n=1 Tax=Ambispora leptoticha TaxID=144679 RepID=A0A9N9E3E5_9GLOM|nr:8524_t:CDS:2 [Ambispora leptoticha]
MNPQQNPLPRSLSLQPNPPPQPIPLPSQLQHVIFRTNNIFDDQATTQTQNDTSSKFPPLYKLKLQMNPQQNPPPQPLALQPNPPPQPMPLPSRQQQLQHTIFGTNNIFDDQATTQTQNDVASILLETYQ